MNERKHCDAVEGGGYHCCHAEEMIKVDGVTHCRVVCCDCGEQFISRSRPVWANRASEHGPYDPRRARREEARAPLDHPLAWRWAGLNPEYEMRYDLTVGYGVFPFHRETGEVCECQMEWNENGTRLTCPVCGLEGT